MIGTLIQNGSEYLFSRRYEGGELLSLWMPVPLAEGEAKGLSMSEPSDFLRRLDELEKSGRSVHGLAFEDSLLKTISATG